MVNGFSCLGPLGSLASSYRTPAGAAALIWRTYPAVSGLILVPTRELALQTSAVVKELGKHMALQCMVSTGGTSLKDDIMRLYNVVHILVGTPGRILGAHAPPDTPPLECPFAAAFRFGGALVVAACMPTLRPL